MATETRKIGRPLRTYPRPCTLCKKVFDVDGFPINGADNKRASACKECKRGNMTARYRQLADSGLFLSRKRQTRVRVENGALANTGRNLNCAHCGQPFNVSPYTYGRQDFCSRDCHFHGCRVYVNGLIEGCFYLGFMSHAGVTQQESRPVTKCKVKACIFPVNGNGKGLCHRHGHFFDYADSMSGELDVSDMFPREGQRYSTFWSGWMWEEANAFNNSRFEYRGARDPGRKTSDEWWKQHVYAGEQQLPKGIQYGAAGFHHGHGPSKSGIKRSHKAQHKAHVANFGNHPSQKPMEKFERETVADLPRWVPPVKSINDGYSGPMCYRELETVVDDDEYEREMAMAQLSRIEGEFEEAFTE